MKKLKLSQRTVLILLGLAFVAGWFYWFQYRPSTVKSECHITATNKAKERYKELGNTDGLFSKTHYDGYYSMCLHSKGL